MIMITKKNSPISSVYPFHTFFWILLKLSIKET
jgi:hypothetical protein